MGCSPLANSRFQMGVTVMGFAEHFGHYDVPASFGCPSCSRVLMRPLELLKHGKTEVRDTDRHAYVRFKIVN